MVMTRVSSFSKHMIELPTVALSTKTRNETSLVDKRIAMLQASLAKLRAEPTASTSSLASVASSVSIEALEDLHEARAKSAGVPLTPKSPVVDAGAKFNPFSETYDPTYVPDLLSGCSFQEFKGYFGESQPVKKVKTSFGLADIKQIAKKIVEFVKKSFKQLSQFVYRISGCMRRDVRKYIDFLEQRVMKENQEAEQKKLEKQAAVFALTVEQYSDLMSIFSVPSEAPKDAISLAFDREFGELQNEALFTVDAMPKQAPSPTVFMTHRVPAKAAVVSEEKVAEVESETVAANAAAVRALFLNS
jgi:hypothetical protein